MKVASERGVAKIVFCTFVTTCVPAVVVVLHPQNFTSVYSACCCFSIIDIQNEGEIDTFFFLSFVFSMG